VVTQVANEINIDEFHSKLLPGDKFAYIENKKQDKNIHLGYVGDGINDAPSLMLADVGISMGISGSSASIEASDVVLATDNPEKVVTAIKISKYTRKIVWQNIILSAIIKLTFLTLGTIGITGMLAAVIADVGVTVVAILNSLRALRFNPKKK
jgi:Cd2+/Zn2+-exporting ATPase